YIVKGKTVTDSVTLSNGSFKFSGTVSAAEPSNAIVVLNTQGTGVVYKDYKSIYLEKGTINVNSADSVSKATVNGTKTNEENAGYEAVMGPINKVEDEVDARNRAATDAQ